MYCPSCGMQLPDNAAFCGRCGKQLQQNPYVVTPPRTAVVAKPKTAESLQRSLLRSPFLLLAVVGYTLAAIGMLFGIFDLLLETNWDVLMRTSFGDEEAIVLVSVIILLVAWIVATVFSVSGVWMTAVGGFSTFHRAKKGCFYMQVGFAITTVTVVLVGALVMLGVFQSLYATGNLIAALADSQSEYDHMINDVYKRAIPVLFAIGVAFIYIMCTYLTLMTVVGSIKHNTNVVMLSASNRTAQTGGIGAAVLSFIMALILLYIHMNGFEIDLDFEPSLFSVSQMGVFACFGGWAIHHNVVSNKIKTIPDECETEDNFCDF